MGHICAQSPEKSLTHPDYTVIREVPRNVLQAAKSRYQIRAYRPKSFRIFITRAGLPTAMA